MDVAEKAETASACRGCVYPSGMSEPSPWKTGPGDRENRTAANAFPIGYRSAGGGAGSVDVFLFYTGLPHVLQRDLPTGTGTEFCDSPGNRHPGNRVPVPFLVPLGLIKTPGSTRGG